MRQSARRPRKLDASRLVTCACSGASSSYDGAGMVSRMVVNSASRSSPVGHAAVLGALERGPAGAGRGVDDREVDLVLGGVEVEEQLVGLVDDLGDARVGAVDLVDHQDDGHLRLERLAQHEPGLGQRPLAGVHEQHDAVDHGQPALDLAAEVGVAGGVDDVDGDAVGLAGGLGSRAAVTDGGVLREDGDALLALEVTGVHRTFVDVLVGAEGAGLPEHGIDEGGLAVVDVGNDGDIADVTAGLHGHDAHCLSLWACS